MTEIPADVTEAARKVVDRGYDEGLLEAIARAILAERERCAEVADTMFPWDVRSLKAQRVAAQAGFQIARAIRNPTP